MIRSLLGQRNGYTSAKPQWWTGILLSIAMGALFYLATAYTIESDSQRRFADLSRNAHHTISARIKSYTDALRGTASLFHTSDELTREQFHRYVEGLSVPQNFPALESVNYQHPISAAARPAFAQ